MAHEAALELTSSNARLIDFSGDDDRSEVRFEWPTVALLEEFGLSRDDIARFWTIWEPLAESVGLRCTFATDDEGVTTLRFAKG
jgi:hypothetical protein